jgi:hypothetical protein
MRAIVALLLATLVGVLLSQSAANSAPAGKKVTIAAPADGNATVAHLVVTAKPKRGKKPKGAVKRPILKATAPRGLVVAVSYKRDPKNTNRWHATVAITNPFGPPANRATSSTQNVVIGISGLESPVGPYSLYVLDLSLDQPVIDLTHVQQPNVRWLLPYCNPPAAVGAGYLVGKQPGVGARDFIALNCILANDASITFDQFEALDLSGLVFDLDPFPGNPNEAYLRFEGVNIPPYNGASFRFPGQSVVAQLPPSGTAGVITTERVTWGNKNEPFRRGQVYRGNVRLNGAFEEGRPYYGQFTTTGGPPYSAEFVGHFTR